MKRSTCLAIGLACLAVAVNSAEGARDPSVLHALRDGASCLQLKDETSCLGEDCSWCSGSVLGDACLANAVAQLIPASMASCKSSTDPDPDMLSKKKKKAASCGDNDNKRDCLDLGAAERDCAWCAGDFMPPSCVSTSAAKFLPETVARCKMPSKKALAAAAAAGDDPAPAPKKPTSCGDIDNKRQCVDDGAEEGDCAWCKGDFMPASCVGVKAAQWIPGTVASCKMPKKKTLAADGATPAPGPQPGPGGQGCMAAKDKHDCLKAKGFFGGCAWCSSSWGQAGKSCVDEMQAKFMPGAKCKFPKELAAEAEAELKDTAAAPAATNELERKHHKGGKSGGGIPYGPGGGSGGSWIPGGGSGGSWIPGGGSGGSWGPWGPGAGPQPGPGMGCSGAKTKKDCLKAKDYMGGKCAFCESQWQGASCMSESQARFQPMAKCKFAKHSKVEAS